MWYKRQVNYWADMGATSFKAYMNITRAELGAAIQEAPTRGLKHTGHLCSVTYPEAAALIKLLVWKHVAVTSTRPVVEQRVPMHSPLNPKAMAVLTPEAREAYLYSRNLVNQAPRERYADTVREYQNDLGLERKFVAAGGLLLAGPAPTGNGGVIPDFGDQRELAL